MWQSDASGVSRAETGIQPNEGERRRWNDEAWASAWPKRERLTTAVTPLLLDEIALQPGETVLDIGTGGGVAALAARRRVGAGKVVGADISEPLLELARNRARAEVAENVSFLMADVQSQAIPGAPFDVAISQFGVMFFDEPVTAFANIRRQLRSGGRLGFACWRSAELNAWFPGPALAGLVPAPPPPAPGKSPTHPFSLADAEQTARLLAKSGWSDVRHVEQDLVVTVPREAIVDEESLGFLGVPEESITAAGEAIERRLAPFARPDGQIDAPLAFQIFTAVA